MALRGAWAAGGLATRLARRYGACLTAGSRALAPWGPPPCRRQRSSGAGERALPGGARRSTAAAASAAPGPPAPAGGDGGALVVTDEAGMEALAAALARQLAPGDAYLLFGAVGAGKSAFSRAFIRAAADDPFLTVPSPTFLLQQIYDDHEGPPIHHFDLYRLEPASDMGRLDMGASFSTAVSLIEWPERLPPALVPQQRAELAIDIIPEAEQQRLECEWQQQRAASGGAAAAGASSSSGSSSSDSEEHGKGEDGWSEEDDEYTDKRWRRVQLRAHGPQWAQRLGEVLAEAAAGGLGRRVVVVDSGTGAGGGSSSSSSGAEQVLSSGGLGTV